MRIRLGIDRRTGKPVYLPLRALPRHLHLVGATGSGKTTTLVTLLTQLFCLPIDPPFAVIIDRLGGFSRDLNRWAASELCPPWVRERYLYIEAADEDRCVPLHPLVYSTPGEGYYRTARAAEITLRGWSAQDLSQQPRLARWLFNCFWSAAQMGLCIADCAHFLYPTSPLHERLLSSLPEPLRIEWEEIRRATGQAQMLLDSCRNRLKPFFVSTVLRPMFSSATSRFDVPRWMREQRIVVLNLAPLGKLAPTDADTIAGLVVNEVLSVARALPPEERQETLLVLDEFQRFVSADLEFALAESRQLKTSLILSHQSFSQLERGDVDLTSLIFQAATRIMLNVTGPDADILARELAGFTFDPSRIHDEIWHRSQRVSGHRVVDLQSSSTASQFAEQWSQSFGNSWRDQDVRNQRGELVSQGDGKARQDSHGQGHSRGSTQTHGSHQTLVPVHEEFEQLASRNFASFDQQKYEWERKLRLLKTGQALVSMVNDDELYEVDIDDFAVGPLALDWETVLRELPLETEAYYQFLEANYRQDCFVSPAQIERETTERLQRVLAMPIPLLAKPAELNTDQNDVHPMA